MDLKNKDIVIVANPKNIAEKLCDMFTQYKLSARLIETPTPQGEILIYLGGLNKFNSIEEAIGCNFEAFKYVKAMMPSLQKTKGIIILIQNTGGSFGYDQVDELQVWASGLNGLSKTAYLECLNSICRTLDLNTKSLSVEQVAKIIFEELMCGGNEIEIGISGNQRITLQAVNQPSVPREPVNYISDQSVVLVSGGARGITAKCLIGLSQRIHPTLILLGRSVVKDETAALKLLKHTSEIQNWVMLQIKARGEILTPKLIREQVENVLVNREINATLHSLRANGCRAEYYAVDVRDMQALQQILQQVRAQYGDITGIIHGAGILADKKIQDKSEKDFERVFNTKIISLMNLLRATEKDQLTLMVLFSSVAARYGNIGQCDYAMANEILNRVALSLHKKYGTACLVKSLNWAPWDGGMVTPELKKNFLARGIEVLPIEKGVQAFCEEILMGDASQVEVVIGPTHVNFSQAKAPPLENNSNGNIPPIFQQIKFLMDLNNYPILDSHKIKGKIVIPIALMIEKIQEFLGKLFHFSTLEISAFQVIKGITFENLHDQFYLIFTLLKEENSDNYLITIKNSANNQLHYQAKMINKTINNSAFSFPGNALVTKPWIMAQIYEEKLFHGTGLHLLAQLKYQGENFGVVQLKEDIHSSFLLIDAALQAGILWAWQVLNKATLPISMANCLLNENYNAKAHQVMIRENSHDLYGINIDAFIMDEKNELSVVLKGVQFYTF